MMISALTSHFIPVIIAFYNRWFYKTKAAQTSPKSFRSLDCAKKNYVNTNTFKTKTFRVKQHTQMPKLIMTIK